MPRGAVIGGQAVVPLQVVDQSGSLHDVDFVVDTGFAGYVVLPSDLVARFDLHPVNATFVRLAGNVRVETDVFELTLLWNDEEVPLEAIMLDGDPMLGMSLLRGNELRMQIEDGGAVEIEPL